MLVVDLNGAYMKAEPFDRAHEEWFRIMSAALDDDSIKEYADTEDWMGKVMLVMEQYLPGVSKAYQKQAARELYRTSIIHMAQPGHLVKELDDYLSRLSYDKAIVTSAPAGTVGPLLQKVGARTAFTRIIESPLDKSPDKTELMKGLYREEKDLVYIGKGDKDLNAIRHMGIPTVSVSWVEDTGVRGDYHAGSVSELDDILRKITDR